MQIIKNIRKFLMLALWMVLGTGVLVLLVAAIQIKKQKACKGVEIEIGGIEKNYFLDKKDILKIISDNGNANPVGKEIEGFDLHELEELLRRNVWVKHAELFFDNTQVLRVKVEEREPVARIFTKNGSSYYIDSSGFRMPLHNTLSVRLPVFTGFPVNQPRLHGADSQLMCQVKKISQYILKDEFWMAQIAQVDITISKTFEMVPTIGNHIIEFGDGENYESKFRNLYVFYRKVLTHTGLDKYSRLNVRYDNQVIGTKKGEIAKYDSIQALKNIQHMIEIMKIPYDSVFTPVKKDVPELKKADSTAAMLKATQKATANVHAYAGYAVKKRAGASVKSPVQVKKPPKKQQVQLSIKKNQPKAIMPKKIE